MMDRPSAIASSYLDGERLRVALEAAKLGDWSWDAATDILTLSRRAAEIFGVEGPSTTLTAIREIVHADDREREHVAAETALGGHSDYNVEYRVRTPAGERWVAASGHGTYAEDGSVAGMIGIAQDITAQMRAKEQFRDQAEALKILNELGRVLSAELDLKKLVLALTDAATSLVRAQFGAFFYKVLDAGGGSYMLYALSGVDRRQFERLPMPRTTALFGPTFRGEGIVRLGRCDARSAVRSE